VVPVINWVLDCDGVLLNSNAVKTEAFRAVASSYGPQVAEDVVEHHLSHGGSSRYEKLARLFDEVLCRPAMDGEMDRLLSEFAAACRLGLTSVEIDPSFELLAGTVMANHGTLRILSGGDEGEIRTALAAKGVEHYFAEVLGSPRPKPEHLAGLVARLGVANLVYLGDSRLDMEMCLDLGVSAVFVAHWSEFENWRSFLSDHPEILKVDDLGDLLRLSPGRHRDGCHALWSWFGSAS